MATVKQKRKAGGRPFPKGQIPAGAKPFKKGQSGNPAGRPSAGLSVLEWWNQMQDSTRATLQSIIDDQDAPVNKISAARIWLYACSEERTTSGSPIAGNELERIMDRTNGKPQQAVDLTSKGESIKVVVEYVDQCLKSD